MHRFQLCKAGNISNSVTFKFKTLKFFAYGMIHNFYLDVIFFILCTFQNPLNKVCCALDHARFIKVCNLKTILELVQAVIFNNGDEELRETM